MEYFWDEGFRQGRSKHHPALSTLWTASTLTSNVLGIEPQKERKEGGVAPRRKEERKEEWEKGKNGWPENGLESRLETAMTLREPPSYSRHQELILMAVRERYVARVQRLFKWGQNRRFRQTGITESANRLLPWGPIRWPNTHACMHAPPPLAWA